MLPSLRILLPCGLVVAAAGAARSLFASLFSAFLLSAMASGALAQPTNDAFANALEIQTAQVLTGTNVGATKELDEPDHSDDGGGSVWWKFTPTVSKRFVLDLAGTDFAAIAAIYTGNSVGSLTHVASEGSPFDLPRIAFNATANTTYYIAVDGWKDGANPHATGTISIRINRVLIVTPDAGVSFEGPEGGPFTPSSVTFTLTAPAGPIDVDIENGASWADVDETEIVDLHTTPVTITLTPNDNAHERPPGLNFAQVHFFGFGSGGEVRDVFLFVEPPSSGNRTISLSANPAAGGTVAGGGTFTTGTSRTVTATPAAAYLFTKWTEGTTTVSTTPSYTFTLNANRTLVAHFALKRTLTVSANPAAGGTVTGGGTFAHGSSRTVTATPKPGYEFLNWTQGANQVAITRSYTFMLTANRTLRANFRSRNDLLVDFGGNGLYQRMNNATWLKVHNASPLAIATGDLDGSFKDEAIGSFTGLGLLARYNNAGAWVRLHTAAPARIVAGDLDGNGRDELIVVFGSGIFARYNNVAPWVKLHASVPQALAVGDLDGNGKDDLIADFGAAGLWARVNNAAPWVRLHASNPTFIATGDLDGNGKDEVIAAFAGGVFARYNNAGAFAKLSAAVAQGLATGDLDGNGKDELLVDFGASGLSARYNNAGAFVRLHATNPIRILTADLDRNGKFEAIASFPSIGLYVRRNNAGAWVRLHTWAEQALAAGGFD